MSALDVNRLWARPAVGIAALVIGLAAPAAAQDSAAAKTEKLLSKGAYTQPQSVRGESTYKTSCVSCHSAKEYTGDAFRVAWVSRTAFDIFDRIKTLMPDDNPGVLPRQDYVDIVAYLFSLNGYPSGPDELPDDDDALKLIRIDAMSGSAPAPRDHSAPRSFRFHAGLKP